MDAFTQSVEAALEQIYLPAQLGQRSALAAPYFLGRHLHAGAVTTDERGSVLVSLLRQAAATLPHDQQRVLSVAYFEADKQPPLNEMRAAALHRSLRTYYRDRTAAVQALADALSRLVVPPLRNEQPRAKVLVERADESAAVLAILRSGKSMALTGPGGAGKSALGTNIANTWPAEHRFWFTVRPGFTDNASALLFGVCHWLREQGVTSAWRQLIANAGKDKETQAFDQIRPMLRHDLDSLRQRAPGAPHALLVCIDEVDLLDPQHLAHDRVLDLIREMRDLVSLLLIGQSLVLETDAHVVLGGLSIDGVAALLHQSRAPSLTAGDLQRLTGATRGLPALVQLFSLLHRLGEPVELALRQLDEGLSTDALFQRVWSRLEDEDRHRLMQLGVYEGVAPWDDPDDKPDAEASSLSLLMRSGLVELGADGATVVAFARPAIARRTPPALRPALHTQAAVALEQRGEYTAAARHYLLAHQPFKAIALWSEHRAVETERGQAESALAVLRQIEPGSLRNDDERRMLVVLRAELYRMTGALTEGLNDLSAITWPPLHPLTPYAESLRGDLHEFTGNIDASAAAYDTALRALAGQREAHEVGVHNRIGFLNLYRARDMQRATQAALQARFRAESFHGKVLEERGDSAGAQERFATAGSLLDQLDHATPARAMNQSDLGRVAMVRGELDAAIEKMRDAIRLYEQVGDWARHAVEHINLSLALNAAGRHAEALQAAEARLVFAQERNDGYLVSALACNAAESLTHLNRLDEAERYIALAMREEEAFHQHYILTVQGLVHFRRQAHARAEQCWSQAIELAQNNEDPFGEAPAWRWRAVNYAQQHDYARAREAMAGAIALFRSMGSLHEVLRSESEMAAWPALS